MNVQMLETALTTAIEVVQEASPELVANYGNVEPELKSDTGVYATDIFTKLDQETEALYQKRLAVVDRRWGFIGEEGTNDEADTYWLVDPIDGTNFFIRGLPFCTSMIALVEDEKVVLSVIHDFIRNDTYHAVVGNGAYKNGEPIHVSTRPIENALLSFESKVDDLDSWERYVRVKDLVGTIAIGTCGFDFAAIASGSIDGRLMVNPNGKDWDYAPGSLLVREAGGVVTNIGKDSYTFKNHDSIMANQAVHYALTEGEEAIFPVPEAI